MRKIPFLFFLLLLLLSNLSAQVSLNFCSSNNAPERKAVIRYLFDAFELYYPEISVTIIDYEDGDRVEKILGGESSRQPHMIMADSVLLSKFLSEELLDIELTTEILEELKIEDFYSGSINAFSSPDGYYGIPYSAWLQVIWYRKDWFEQENLPPPETLENLDHSSTLFNQPAQRLYGIILGSENDEYLRQCFLQIAQAAGLELKSNDNNCFFERLNFLDGLNIYKNLLANTPPYENYWRSRDFYFQNKAAILLYSTHLMDDLALPEVAADSLTGAHFTELKGADYSNELLENTGMITTLFGSTPSSFGSISGIGILNSEDPEIRDAQKKLAHFLFQIDVYTTWLHMSPGGMLPVRPSILEEESFYRDSGGVLKRFGREKIIELSSGIETLRVTNPECLLRNPDNHYTENDFKELLYQLINSDTPTSLVDSVRWIR